MMTTQQASGGARYWFLYTADDERIGKLEGSGVAVNRATWTVRGLDNKVLRTWESTGGTWATDTWTWKEDHVYRGGQLLAAVEPDGSGGTATKHFHLDHLGTPRLVTDESAQEIARHTYYPFGEEATSDAQDAERMKFTGHERDRLASGDANELDYMHARYYSGMMGRFVSVDPNHILSTTLRPQVLNRYSYGRNNVILYIDPDGREEDNVIFFHLLIALDYSGDFQDRSQAQAAYREGLEFGRSYFGKAAIFLAVAESAVDYELGEGDGWFDATVNGLGFEEWYEQLESKPDHIVIVSGDSFRAGLNFGGGPLSFVYLNADEKTLTHELLHGIQDKGKPQPFGIFENLSHEFRIGWQMLKGYLPHELHKALREGILARQAEAKEEEKKETKE